MTKGPPDYFKLKPVRGSSPTASLAADLSQNFHIDRRFVETCVPKNQLSDNNFEQSPIAHTTPIAVLLEPL